MILFFEVMFKLRMALIEIEYPSKIQLLVYIIDDFELSKLSNFCCIHSIITNQNKFFCYKPNFIHSLGFDNDELKLFNARNID